jgi:hypothetical protein
MLRRYLANVSSSELAASVIDCSEFLHGLRHVEHYNLSNNIWVPCDQQPCPNRFHSIEVATTGSRRLYCQPVPEAFLPSSPEAVDAPLLQIEAPPREEVFKPLPKIHFSPLPNPSPPPGVTMAQPATNFQQLLEQLAALMAALTTHNAQPAPTINAQVMVPAHVTQGNQKKDTVQKPQTFHGSHDQTRSFLASFQIWATVQEEAMNTYKTGRGYVKDDCVWIITALSFMKGTASIWETNYQADYNEGKPIFDNKWDTFVMEFRQN